MTRDDYYSIYQANIELLEVEMQQVKKTLQMSIGKKNWLEENGGTSDKIALHEKEILASTRLMSFLVCSWYEARLMKMLYENSSAAFTDDEISHIRSLRNMKDKWKWAFYVAIGKVIGKEYTGSENYEMDFPYGSIAQKNYLAVVRILDDIYEAIEVRNRLAHGQWMTQLNSSNTSIKIFDFINKYDNIQKLDIIVQIFKDISEIINKYVVYKDKSNPNFDLQVEYLIKGIEDKKIRIQKSDFHKYERQLGKTYSKNLQKAWLSNMV